MHGDEIFDSMISAPIDEAMKGSTMAAQIIKVEHCESCGSTDPENVNTMYDPDFQGYSACCNEPVVTGESCRTGCTHD